MQLISSFLFQRKGRGKRPNGVLTRVSKHIGDPGKRSNKKLSLKKTMVREEWGPKKETAADCGHAEGPLPTSGFHGTRSADQGNL